MTVYLTKLNERDLAYDHTRLFERVKIGTGDNNNNAVSNRKAVNYEKHYSRNSKRIIARYQ